MSAEERYTDKEWLMVQRHAKLIAGLKEENKKLTKALEDVQIINLNNYDHDALRISKICLKAGLSVGGVK